MSKKQKELIPPMTVSIPPSQAKTDAQKEKLAKQFVSWLSSIEGMPENSMLHLTFSCEVQTIDEPQRPVSAAVKQPGSRATTTAATQDQMWVCTKCKTENPGKAPSCILCSERRPRVGPSEVATLLSKIAVPEVPPGFPPKPDFVDKFEGNPRENQEAYKEFARKKMRFKLWEDSILAYRLRIKEGNKEAAEKVVKELRKAFDLPENPESEKESSLQSSDRSSKSAKKPNPIEIRNSGSTTPASTTTTQEGGMEASDIIAMKLLAQFEAMGITVPASPKKAEEPVITVNDEPKAPETADEIADKLLATMGFSGDTESPAITPLVTPRDTDGAVDEPKYASDLPELKIPSLSVPKSADKGKSPLSKMRSPRDFGPLLDNEGNLTRRTLKEPTPRELAKSPRGNSLRNFGPLFDGEDETPKQNGESNKPKEQPIIEEREEETPLTFNLEPEDYKATAQRVLASLAESLIEDDAEREKSEKMLEIFDAIEKKVEHLRGQAEPENFAPPQVAKLGKDIRELLNQLPGILEGMVDEKPFVQTTNLLLASLLRFIRSKFQTTGETAEESEEMLSKSIGNYVTSRDTIHQAILNQGEWRKREELRAAAHAIIEEIAANDKPMAILTKIQQYVNDMWKIVAESTSAFNPTEVVRLAKVIKESLTSLGQHTHEAPEEVEFAKVTQLLTATLLRLSKSKHSGSSEALDANVTRAKADFDTANHLFEKSIRNFKTPQRLQAEKLLEEIARKDKNEKLKKHALSAPKKKTATNNSSESSLIAASSSKSKPTLPSLSSVGGLENNEAVAQSAKRADIPSKNSENPPDLVARRGRSSSAPQTPREKSGAPIVESQLAILLNADEASEALDVEIAEANFEDVSSRLSALEDLFSQLASDSEDEEGKPGSEKHGKMSVMDLFGLSPLPEKTLEFYDEDDASPNPSADVGPSGDEGEGEPESDSEAGKQWPPRKKNVQYQPKNQARLKRSSQELRNKQQLRHLQRQTRGRPNSGGNSTSSSVKDSSSNSAPPSPTPSPMSVSVPVSSVHSFIDLPEGFPPPPEVNQELAKFASLSLGDPQATITRKNREQYKEYMRQKLMYEQWENGLILYRKRLAEGNRQACDLIVERLAEELVGTPPPSDRPLTPTTPTSASAPSTTTTTSNNNEKPEISENSSETAVEKKRKKYKVQAKELKEKRGSKAVKMLSGVGNFKARTGSDPLVPDALKKKEKKLNNSANIMVSNPREKEDRNRATIDGVPISAKGEGSSGGATPSATSLSLPGTPTRVSMDIRQSGDTASIPPSSSSTNSAVLSSEEKRQLYKRTKSSEALGRLSRVFKLET